MAIQAIMAREAENPEFGFLFDLRSPEHAYYRWRLYSLASARLLSIYSPTIHPVYCLVSTRMIDD